MSVSILNVQVYGALKLKAGLPNVMFSRGTSSIIQPLERIEVTL